MKQQCTLVSLYMSGAFLLAVFSFLVWKGSYALALVLLAAVPIMQWIYVRVFPSISPYIGYGSVADQPAQQVARAPGRVTLYTAMSCPFCPLVKSRLLALQKEMGFILEEIDVTFKPNLLRAKGIQAVPVVEAGEQRLTGNATSEQLASLIKDLSIQT